MRTPSSTDQEALIAQVGMLGLAQEVQTLLDYSV